MKGYVCPVCDHVMKGRYYCRICRQFVKEPYYIDINYSLDRTSAQPNVCDCDVHTNGSKEEIARKRKEQQELDRDYQEAYGSSYMDLEKKKKLEAYKKAKAQKNQQQNTARPTQPKKKKRSAIWTFIVIYILFQLGMLLIQNIDDDMLGQIQQEFIDLTEQELPAEPDMMEDNFTSGDWTYKEIEHEEALKEGEESTGITHFAADGTEFTDELHKALNDADFDVLETLEYMDHYIAVNETQEEKYSYYQRYQTYYLTEDYMEYYRISNDSVSGRLISTEIESKDYDQVCFYTKEAARLLLPDGKNKKKKMKRLDTYLETLPEDDMYFAESIGNIMVSGYVYTNENMLQYHISLSAVENE